VQCVRILDAILDQENAMWNRFAFDARTVNFHAIEIAQLAGSRILTPIHILLGLLHEGAEETVACNLLRDMGVSLSAIESEAKQHAYTGLPIFRGNDVQVSASAQKVYSDALNEARRFSLLNLDTEHILIGLAMCTDEAVSTILGNHGITPLRVQVALESQFANLSPSIQYEFTVPRD
jgi:ATP-dependent Clp protease ATP-binding subunit ClpA